MAIKLITGLKETEDIQSEDDGARIYGTISSGDRVLDIALLDLSAFFLPCRSTPKSRRRTCFLFIFAGLFSAYIALLVDSAAILTSFIDIPQHPQQNKNRTRLIWPQKVRQKFMVMQLKRIGACIAQDSVLLVLP